MEEVEAVPGLTPMSCDVFCPGDLCEYCPVDPSSGHTSSIIYDQGLDFAYVLGSPTHSVDLIESTDLLPLHLQPWLDSATQPPPVPVLSSAVADGACELSLRPEMVENHSLDTSSTASPSKMRSHRGMGAVSSTRSNAKEVFYTDDTPIPVCTIPKAVHMCNLPGCKNKTAFKRREHLKRHQNTKHGLGPEMTCDFCVKKFNRRDNWRQHLRLHTEPNRRMARTNFHIGAVLRYNEEKEKIKPRRQPLKGNS